MSDVEHQIFTIENNVCCGVVLYGLYCLKYVLSTEKAMTLHSSTLAWRIPGMGEPGGLQSMGSHRVGHDCSDLAAAAACSFYADFPENFYHK